jgi:hypothetical protein
MLQESVASNRRLLIALMHNITKEAEKTQQDPQNKG